MLSSPQSSDLRYEIGDCIEFKRFVPDSESNSDYVISKGKIVNNDNQDLLEVQIYSTGDICWVNPISIINYYPKPMIPRLSVRLMLKKKWKDLIFREVKTVKTKEQYTITYKYVNDNGFVRTKKFDSFEDALQNVPDNKKHNIQFNYWDYYGFTTHRAIRNNDIYCHREIFFSKKCYGELNINNSNNSNNGNSDINCGFCQRHGFNNVPPQKKQYICGLVEAGEKGLFFRKWFPCSPEFLILWTMVCEPDHHSLKNNINGNYIPKTFNEILKELDTSKYDITNSKHSIEWKKKYYRINNVENHAIHMPNLYQRIAVKLFKTSTKTKDELYQTYEDRLEKDLLWMKNFTRDTSYP